MTAKANPAPFTDQRTAKRYRIQLTGKLFVPAEDCTLDCLVKDLSSGGAGLACPVPPPLATFVLLYIEGFGRFESVTTRYVHGELGLRFVCNDAKRKKLERDLIAYTKEGLKGVTRLRRAPRTAPKYQIDHFTLQDGSEQACQLANVSLQGAMVQTAARPALGEMITLGQALARVVRHHSEGIGVQFIDPAPFQDRTG